MPERNFEQQARDMTNGFEMKPKPEVWQNVRNAIQEPKRKRRFVLWWWLLPLGLLGGSIWLYVYHPDGELVQVKKAISMPQKSSETTTQIKLPPTQQVHAEKKIKEDKGIVVK